MEFKIRLGHPHKKKKLHWVVGFLRNRRLFKLFETTLPGSFQCRRIQSWRVRRWLNARCGLGSSQRSGRWIMQQSASIPVQLEHIIVGRSRTTVAFAPTRRETWLFAQPTMTTLRLPRSDLLLKKLWSSRSLSQRWKNSLRAHESMYSALLRVDAGFQRIATALTILPHLKLVLLSRIMECRESEAALEIFKHRQRRFMRTPTFTPFDRRMGTRRPHRHVRSKANVPLP